MRGLSNDQVPRRRSRLRGSIGATLVEYSLIVALVVVPSIGAMNYLTGKAKNETNNQADCISTRPPPPSCQVRPLTTTTTDPSVSTVSTVPPSSVTSSTTEPPSTVPPSTEPPSTEPPSTVPPSTVPTLKNANVTLTGGKNTTIKSGSGVNTKYYETLSGMTVTVKDSSTGAAIGSVSVNLTITDSSTGTSQNHTCTTRSASTGRGTCTLPNIDGPQRDAVNTGNRWNPKYTDPGPKVTFTVTAVSGDGNGYQVVNVPQTRTVK